MRTTVNDQRCRETLAVGEAKFVGEAYAFGVVWSFVFQALSMVVLRFKDRRPREFKVPLNVRIGKVEIPIGLGLILLVLTVTAVIALGFVIGTAGVAFLVSGVERDFKAAQPAE